MPFRFRLQRIYDVRRKEEETLKNDLSKINEKVENIKRIIQQLSTEKKQIESNFLHKGVLRKEDLLNMEMQMVFYEEEIKKRQSELYELLKEQEETRRKLFEKMKERKILEKLKERKMREYLYEENLKERKTMDEIAERKFWWES
ncbi:MULTISPECIES: flagellar export protein FliJ [unclassified Thermotoga]|uniref:flagellar export protein FliJ n=1 Tax=unclassified Thermotoga TaxID=2631113 RepID=UPI000280EA01|nr:MULTISPECIES: flagellar export protein FliJ [unclassified Thermotoga]AIY85976.1 flagellar export protein FliJ [Thermotoga sp. 2812B]EJX26739.1 flagellar export protein FliJ [Thermotoga sp. EMP]